MFSERSGRPRWIWRGSGANSRNTNADAREKRATALSSLRPNT